MSRAAFPAFEKQFHHGSPPVADCGCWIGAGLLAALVIAPNFPLRPVSTESIGQVDLQLFLRLGLCAACGVYGLLFCHPALKCFTSFPMAWMVLIGCWAVATIPFAIDMRVAVASCGIFWSVLFFVPAVSSRLGMFRTLRVILAGTVIYVGSQWLLYFVVPSFGFREDVLPDGSVVNRVGGDSQQLGFQAAVLAGLVLVFGFSGKLRKRWQAILLALALVTLVGAKSRTAWIAILLAMAALLLRRLSARQIVGICGIIAGAGSLFFIGLAIGAVTIGLDTMAVALSRTGNAEEVTNLTGRAEIWPYVADKIRESPITGWGYGCAAAAAVEFVFPLRHAHNEILHVALCLGCVGAGFALAMFLQQLGIVWKTRDDLPVYVTLMTITAGLTESVVFIAPPTILMILWLIVLCRQPLSAERFASAAV